jgi:Fe-S-cluster containining protein
VTVNGGDTDSLPADHHRSADAPSAEAERTAYRHRLDVFLASRDAGEALTADSLRRGIRLDAVVDAAAKTAGYADAALSIVYEEYRPPLHCRESCCYCCCKPGVLVSIPELVRILDHVHATFEAGAISDVALRARRYAAQLEGRSFDDPTNASVPCPLLAGSRCSVYECRPLVCRGYNSTDVDACRAAHDDANATVPIFAILKDVTDGTTVGAARSLEAAGCNHALVDLGTALNIALGAGAGASQAILDDGSIVSAAENRSHVGDLWASVRETARQLHINV